MTNSSLNFLTSKKNLEELMSIAKPVTSLNKYKKGIYLIVIGEVFYIGKTNSKKGFISRFYTHNSNLRKYKSDLETYGSFEEVFRTRNWDGKHLYSKMGNAISVYKKEVEYFILEEYNDIEEETLKKIESEYIRKYNADIYGLNQFEVIILAHTLNGARITNNEKVLNMFLNFNYLKSTFTEYKETLELIKQNNWRKYFWINFNFINSRGFFNNIINEYIQYNRKTNIIEGNKFTKIEKNILLNLIKEIELLSEEILFGELINFKKNNTILFEREVRNETNNKLIKRTTVEKNKTKIFLYTFLTILIIAVVIIIFKI